jgi:hypothetical protein
MRKPSVPSKQHTRRHGSKTTRAMTHTTSYHQLMRAEQVTIFRLRSEYNRMRHQLFQYFFIFVFSKFGHVIIIHISIILILCGFIFPSFAFAKRMKKTKGIWKFQGLCLRKQNYNIPFLFTCSSTYWHVVPTGHTDEDEFVLVLPSLWRSPHCDWVSPYTDTDSFWWTEEPENTNCEFYLITNS